MNRVENAKALFTTHGMTGIPEHGVWKAMLRRCYNHNTKDYPDYGARGIVVCDRWRRSFANFIEDMGRRPSANHSIERKNTNGDYTPDNCKWATRKEQANNTRRNRRFTIRGTVHSLSEWCGIFKVGYIMVHHRLARGWSIEDALTRPKRGCK